MDLKDGSTHIEFRRNSKTADVVFVVVLTILRYAQLGYHWITLLMDHARTHGRKMEAEVRQLLTEIIAGSDWDDLQRTTVEFLHTPRYSPAFNPAEYLIHWVRQDALYHLPCHFTLQEKADRVRDHLAQGPPLTPAQMQRLLHHIYRLPHDKKAKKWPKLE